MIARLVFLYEGENASIQAVCSIYILFQAQVASGCTSRGGRGISSMWLFFLFIILVLLESNYWRSCV